MCFNCKLFIIFLFNFRRRGCSLVYGVYKEFCKDDVLKECFLVVFYLYYFVMIIFFFIVVVERGFFLMLNIVLKKRNRFIEKNIDVFMCICYINKDLIDNDLEIIVINFKGFKKRKFDM